MSTDTPIVMVEAAPGAAITKHMNRQGKPEGYEFPIVYTLSDGRRIPSKDVSKLRRDAVSELASLPHAPRYPTCAMFQEGDSKYSPTKDGDFIGITVSFSLR